MKVLILILALVAPCFPQTKADLTEAATLRNNYIAKLEEDRAALDHLAEVRFAAEFRAKLRLDQAEEMRKEGLISATQLQKTQQEYESAKAETAAAERRLAEAKKGLREVPTVTAIARDLKKTRRSKKCDSWTLTAYQKQRGKTIINGVSVTCTVSR